ncbi:hypothetical protein Lalb_Chr05g0226351 [Lupinus albus]|uniref:Late nodulin n=1 Tax=Lupinus albus TaxID=3870 RepID=A0A6A4QK03_LUPAL|nr:hypothetical protein Lalb_Chr05g0226351 [Lupinus albus]
MSWEKYVVDFYFPFCNNFLKFAGLMTVIVDAVIARRCMNVRQCPCKPGCDAQCINNYCYCICTQTEVHT